MADVELIQPIKDGKVTESTANKKKESSGNTELGKDEFLKLLVCQMQNQNPLEPSSDTEWISQLANFSSLEEMQNMGSTMTGLQGMNMVGKYVHIVSKTESGNTTAVSGLVDYVNVKDGKVQVSVNDKLYDSTDVQIVYDDEYVAEQVINEAIKDNASSENNNSENTNNETANKEV